MKALSCRHREPDCSGGAAQPTTLTTGANIPDSATIIVLIFIAGGNSEILPPTDLEGRQQPVTFRAQIGALLVNEC
jgi:hypothetical protein